MPQGFNIGPVTIRFYALIILAGALLGTWVAGQMAKRDGKSSDDLWDILPWLLLGGILGARLWHVFTPSASNIAAGTTTAYYMENPIRILQIWHGGLGIPGGVIGGAIAALIYCKVRRISFAQIADWTAPGLLIAQAIGRWGNFVNQELYGGPSDLPWAIFIEPQYRLPGFAAVERYHPLFLYEFILNVLGALLLIWVGKRFKGKLFKGDIFNLYLVVYPVIRFALEFVRLDPSPVAGININQTTMMVVALLAGVFFILRHTVWPPKPNAETEILTPEAEAELAADVGNAADGDFVEEPELDSEEIPALDEEVEDVLDENEEAVNRELDEKTAEVEDALEELGQSLDEEHAELEDAAKDAADELDDQNEARLLDGPAPAAT